MNIIIERHICLSVCNQAEIVHYYRQMGVEYPKFFKMDCLSKMAFVASEMLLADMPDRFELREDVAVIFFNSSSSLAVDTDYQTTIRNNDDYFPSPALFVYTLPNICAGEVAIRNKFCGETSFYVIDKFDIHRIFDITRNTFENNQVTFALIGWIENYEDVFEVKMAKVYIKQ